MRARRLLQTLPPEKHSLPFPGPREPWRPGPPTRNPQRRPGGRWERRQHTCTQKFSAHLKVKFNRYLVLFICFLNVATLISVHPGQSGS